MPRKGRRKELSYLEVFMAVAERENYTKGAKHLGMAQASVSKALGKLRARVGVDLFRPQGRGVVLTPAGRRLMEYGRKILAWWDEAMEVMDEIREAGEDREERAGKSAG